MLQSGKLQPIMVLYTLDTSPIYSRANTERTTILIQIHTDENLG